MASGRNSRSTKTQCEITMPESYTRLTKDERYQIYEGVTEKRSHREIAVLINKYHSTVSK
jgi:IS30 family transposase